MKENILLLSAILLGGMMISITFSSLGEQGNKTMHFIGTILILYSIVVLLKRAFQNFRKIK